MAYLDTDSKRFALLLNLGTHQGELRRFFTECKAQLLIRRAKVQNLPHGRDERIKTICERFTRRTDDVVRSWFAKNVSMNEPMPIDEVVLYLSAHFDEGEPLPESDKHAICRSALANLFSEDPSGDLILALKSSQENMPSIITVDEEHSNGDGFTYDENHQMPNKVESERELQTLQPFQLSELLGAIILNDEIAIDNALAPFGEHTQIFVEAMLRVRDGSLDAARESLSMLDGHGAESELLLSALSRASHTMNSGDVRGGVRATSPRPLDSDPSLTTHEIVGVFTNETEAGAVFVDPIYLVLHGNLFELSVDDRVRLFPESGSVMSHRTVLRRQLSRNEYVHWSVSEREGPDGRRTRYHLVDELPALRRVVAIDVPSGDADEVRARIREYALAHRAVASQQPMFVLSDGVVIGSPKSADITRDEGFEAPWQAWATLDTWLIEGHQYYIGTASGNTSHVDLSPLDVSFRRILKNLDSEKRLSMTKAQRSELSLRLRDFAGGEVTQRAKRVAASIDQILLDGEQLDAVLSLLDRNGQVNDRVEELISKDFAVRQAERAGLNSEIATLRKKKAELESASREVDRATKEKLSSVASTVRTVFADAINDGAASVAKAEVFRLLSGGERTQSLDHTARSESGGKLSAPTLTVNVTPKDIEDDDFARRLAVFGLHGRQTFILSSLLRTAARCGLLLVLRGVAARHCALAMARRGKGDVAIVDVPMGLTSSNEMNELIEQFDKVNAVAMLNADLSPAEVYGAKFLDLIAERLADPGRTEKEIVIACQGGNIALPIPGIVERLSLIVDLDGGWDGGNLTLDDIDLDSPARVSGPKAMAVELLRGMDESDRRHVEGAFVRSLQRP